MMKSRVKKATNIFDEIAVAIRGASACASELSYLDERRRDKLDQFEEHLRKLCSYPNVVEAPEAEKLLKRIERLRELRNMEEYGSLALTVERDMQAIWERLPK